MIKPFDSLMLATEYLRELIRGNEELREKCRGESAVIVGLEPLCRKASKQLRMDMYHVEQREGRIFSTYDKSAKLVSFPDAHACINACQYNSHYGIMSSFNPERSVEDNRNKRGCVCFDVTEETKLFKRQKKWVRYYISVQAGGASGYVNEMLASSAAEFLSEMVEVHKLMPVEEIQVSILGAMKSKKYMYSTPSSVEIMVTLD